MKKICIVTMVCMSLIYSVVGCTSNRNTEEEQNKSVYNGLFDDSFVHKMDVTISDKDWAELLETPGQKTKYEVSVTIDGNTMDSVSFATKGNLSLEQVGFSGSHRYSFKIIFDKFNKEQTYGGLDKLNLQNLHVDATYMKDYISYAMMKEVGVAAPLSSYVELSINGKIHGLYLAVEDLDESFLQRNFGMDYGALYKPEDEGRFTFEDGLGELGSIDMQSYKGADLSYIDDSFDSYIDIFNNNQTKTDDDAKKRMVEALKKLSEGKELDSYVDIDAVVRYFVAHNFVLNSDSYTGYAPHNYGLYEKNGKLSMLPWDYNLAFSMFNGNDATMLVNYPMDTPLATEDEKRPMWTMLMNEDGIRNKYHKEYKEFLSSYFESGRFEEQINRIYNLIRDYVKKDPSAWYSVEQFDTAVDTLKRFCKLCAQSIQGQLDGKIPSTKQGQEEKLQSLIDSGDLDVNAMGAEEDLFVSYEMN